MTDLSDMDFHSRLVFRSLRFGQLCCMVAAVSIAAYGIRALQSQVLTTTFGLPPIIVRASIWLLWASVILMSLATLAFTVTVYDPFYYERRNGGESA